MIMNYMSGTESFVEENQYAPCPPWAYSGEETVKGFMVR